MSELFRDPGIPHGEQTHYAASAGGQQTSQDLLARVEHDGDEQYRHLVEVRQDGFAVDIEQTFQRAGGMLRAESYQMTTQSDGKLVSREEGYFVDTRHLQFGGDVAPFPRDIVPLIGGMVALRGLDFRRGAKRTVHIWLAFSVFWPIELKVERLEQVTVPAGSMQAWRVKVRPSFKQISGLLDTVVGGLLPPFVLHFAAEAPHRMLRFEFPTGPMPWNPRGLIEATKLD